MLERARANEKIRWQLDSEVLEVLGENSVTGVRLRDTLTGEESTIDVTGVFMAIGHDPRSELVRDQLEIDAEGYVLTQAPTTYTKLDGVFAAGDLVDRTYRQAITAAGSGCAAAIDAERWLADHEESDEAHKAAELVGGGYAPTEN
jgi:thioredoxin reductase (NADPH)